MARKKRKGHFNGAIVEVLGKVQNASTHFSCVGVDIAVVECDCAADDADATSVAEFACCV